MIFSLILRTATRLIIPLLLVFSIFLLLRGHDLPGGGFVGGLVAATAFVLYAFSRGNQQAVEVLRAAPRALLGLGLSCALGSGLIGLFAGGAFLRSLWLEIPLPGDAYLKLGTTLLFDIGVFLVVIGTILLMVFSVGEDDAPLTERL